MPPHAIDTAKAKARHVVKGLPSSMTRPLRTLLNRRGMVEDRSILGRSLRVEGYNHIEVDYDDAWLVLLLAASTGFVDVGCNIGFFAMVSCVLRPDAQVLAIDANPECAAVTAANLVRNGFGDRTRVISSFVSDSRHDVKFNAVGLGAAGSGVDGLSTTAEDLGSSDLVQANSLDDLVASVGFVPDLIKVDVEGAEREVLRGAVSVAALHRPKFMVEMHSGFDLTMEQNTADVLAWCSANDYRAWYLATGEELADASTVAHRGRCHLLLQPSDHLYPDALVGVPQGASIESLDSESLAGRFISGRLERG